MSIRTITDRDQKLIGVRIVIIVCMTVEIDDAEQLCINN